MNLTIKHVLSISLTCTLLLQAVIAQTPPERISTSGSSPTSSITSTSTNSSSNTIAPSKSSTTSQDPVPNTSATGTNTTGSPSTSSPSTGSNSTGIVLFASGTNADTGDANEEIYIVEELSFDGLDTASALKAIQDLTDGVKDIATQLKSIQDNTTLNIEQYKDVKTEVVRVIRSIAETNGDLAKKVRKMNLIRAEMKETRETIKQLKNDVEASKAYIIRFTEFLYRLNNEFYDQNYDLDEIKLFIKSDSIAGTLSNETLIQSLIARLNDLIIAMRQQQKSELSLLKKLNELELTSREDIRSYKTQLENLTQKKRYLQAFLVLYKMDASRFKGELKDLFETRKDIQNTVIKIAGDRAAGSYTTPQYDTPALREALASLTQYGNPSQTPFSWPLLPVTTLGALYKDPAYKLKYGYEHLALEVPSSQGTPLYAPRDGIVLEVADTDGISINRIVLGHTDKYVSSYVYLNKVLVKPGQIVRRGQLMGYSGGEPGTRGAGFASRGPNLSFSVFKNGTSLDPLAVLNLSAIKDQTILPSLYEIKYLKDISRRAINITTTSFMPGETVIERRLRFLNTYGVGIFRQLPFREDAAAGTNVDVDMGICIGFAESTLGAYLTTDNNIGNVGNNDRGDRVPFSSALAGARSIYTTLNNVYLRKYHRIDELSGYGNKKGSIYASSQFNRQNNVMRCLSMIKGYYVPEDYPFRNAPAPDNSVSFGE